uniref:Beta-Casp domain-containing protein n=1 Tax=Steinernema glaseri TaxID=37863 RepID=A0A1I7ZWE9_9BILA
MEITSLSPIIARPCHLVKLKSANVTILIDPMIDLSTLQSYVPFSLLPTGRFSKISHGDEKFLRQCENYTFVDGTPEIRTAPLHMIKMQDVDAILISHYTAVLALPFYTEGTGFEGVVYCTEPTAQLGTLVAEEMLEYLERCNTDSNPNWKDPDYWRVFVNDPTSDPRDWRSFYSKRHLLSSLKLINHISFRQTMTVGGSVSVSAYGSGYSVGSCNWKIATENESVVYLSHTSARQAHINEVQWDHMRSADHLVLTTMCLNQDNSPNEQVLNIGKVVVETLRKGGNVLLPMAPTGTIYDMFEILCSNMDGGQISVEVPIYFVSPVADSTLAYANIYAEYLSLNKQQRVYIPEEPFSHTQMIKNGRVKVYKEIHGQFSKEFKTPCVMITGHPSLRIGDAVHFLEMWGSDSRNSLIMTDPDYPLEDVYGPFKTFAIRAHYFPVETRLDHSQLGKITSDLDPKQIYAPPEIKHSIEQFWSILSEVRKINPATGEAKYLPNALRGLSKWQIDFYRRILDSARPHMPPYHPYDKIHALTYGLPYTLSAGRPTRKVHVHPDVLRGVNVTGHNTDGSIGMGAIRGYLSVYDNVYELNPVPEKELQRVRKRSYGKLDLDLFQKKLQGFKIQFSVNVNADHSSTFSTNIGTVWVNPTGMQTRISSTKRECRTRLAEIVRHCLKSI